MPSTIVIVAVWPLTAAPPLPAIAVPRTATPAAASVLLMMLSPAIGVVIEIDGPAVFSANVTGALAPVLPAASVSWATMPRVLLPDRVKRPALQAPSLPTAAVPTCVVTPFTVSNNVTVAPAAASVAVTWPEIVCVG